MIILIARWFLNPAHWAGPDGVVALIAQHLVYSALALLIAGLIALPIGLFVGHTRKGAGLITGFANSLRALPSLGLIVLLVILFGPLFTSDLAFILPSLIVLILLAVPPIMMGAYAGMVAVDAAVVDAARGMGYRPLALLWQVEIPCALPLILSGCRGATLQVVSTATIAAYVSLGGLGRLIIDGRAQNDYAQMACGAVLIGVLALIVDLTINLTTRLVTSPGLVRGKDPAPTVRSGLLIAAFTVAVGLFLADHASPPPAPAATKSNEITIGSADFPESELLATIFAKALAEAGIPVATKLNIGSREAYMPALRDGSIDLIPDYIGATLEYLDATTTAHNTREITASLRQHLPAGITLLAPSVAEDSDVLVVTRATAEAYHLKAISDLAPVAGQLVLGGPPEWKTRHAGVIGLKKVYGLTFKSFKTLDVTGPITLSALLHGQVQLADLTSADPAIAQEQLVVLEDPKNLFPAQNIALLVSTRKLNSKIVATLDAVTAALTTRDLIEMNARLANHESFDDVAGDWVKGHKLP